MLRSPIVFLPKVLTALLLMTTAAPAPACLPSPIGLEALITVSEQAVYVEILEVERTSVGWLESKARHWRSTAVEASEFVSDDLGLLAETYLPEIETKNDHLLYRVHARVLSHLNPGGPRVGSLLSWPLRLDFRRKILPGRRAVVFLDKNPGPLSFLRLQVIEEPDAVLVLADHQDPAEFTALMEAGFVNQHQGLHPTEEWLVAAVRSPISRVFLKHYQYLKQLNPEVIADALVQEPSGTRDDLRLLDSLGHVDRDDLDLFALDLVAGWIARDDSPGAAVESIQLALERWRVPFSEGLHQATHKYVGMEPIRAIWQEILQEEALPATEDPTLSSKIAAWREMVEESRTFHRALTTKAR